MPQALEIVPSVVEEFDDEMEIDSGNGPDSHDTLAACVQCLLQCLNPATAGSGEGQLPYGKAPTPSFKMKKKQKKKEKI